MPVARALSAFFHPAFINFYFALLLFFTGRSGIRIHEMIISWWQMGLILLITYLLPVSIYMVAGERLKNYLGYLSARGLLNEKLLLLVLMVLINFGGLYLLQFSSVSKIYLLFHLGSIFLACITILIFYYWNISIYMIAAGAFTGALLGIFTYIPYVKFTLLYWVILLSGLIGYSRMVLGKHSPAQIYSGYLLGAVVMYLYFSLAIR